MQTIDTLNEQFGIADQLHFTVEEGGFIVANINNQFASAKISTYAAQVLSYKPHSDDHDLVFLSEKAVYQTGKAIRGGVPICWPWFGDDTSGLGRPSHGFMRNRQWTVLQARLDSQGRVSVVLGCNANENTKNLWPYDFELSLEVIVGQEVELKLETKNTSSGAFTITQALHTYFNISDIKNITVSGLDNKKYLDKLEDFSENLQQGDVMITQEIDRVFQPVRNKVKLIDSGFNRTINISASGSETAVIWNPWTTAISSISDLDNLHYRRFLCVETANTAQDSVIIPAGKSHCMSVSYSIT
jgi:glucose-6-phosphate 1-epimerase